MKRYEGEMKQLDFLELYVYLHVITLRCQPLANAVLSR